MSYRNFDDETLEREYTPASLVRDVQIYLDSYKRRGELARLAVDHQKMHYGDHPDEWLWYAPATVRHPKKLIVFVHGGFWRKLSADDCTFLSPNWHRLGYSVASINYSLCPTEELDVLVDQTSRAINFLSALHQPQNTVLIGHSAGAQLVAMSMCNTAQHQFVQAIFISGVFDLEPIMHMSVNDAVRLDVDKIHRLSPIHHVSSAQNTPISVIWGEHETNEFKRQSIEFAQVWSQSANKRNARTLEVKNRNHFDILDELTELSTLRLIE